MAGPQVGFSQPGQSTTTQNNPQASWPRPAGSQPALPQGTAPQNQFPIAGQPQAGQPQAGQPQAGQLQAGFPQPVQNQPNNPQRWPNTGSQTPQGSVAPGNGANQGIVIDNVGDLNANGVMTGTAPFNTTDSSNKTQNATESAKPTGNGASYKLWPSALGILAILSLF